MADDRKELLALTERLLVLALQGGPTGNKNGPAVHKLADQLDGWKRRQAHTPETPSYVEVASILSHRTKQGLVELTLNREKIQMDLDKAREVVGMLHAAIEAAITDQLVVAFLMTKVGLAEEAAMAALVDIREMRQGSRETVYPS